MGFERPIGEEEAQKAGEMPSDLSRGADTDRPFTIPMRPKGEKRGGAWGSRPTTPGFVVLVFFLIVLAIGIHYYNSQTQAVTTINTTITENDDLNNGLIGHWTFDGPDMNWASSTAEVKNSIAGNGDGNLSVESGPEAMLPGRIGQAVDLCWCGIVIPEITFPRTYFSTTSASQAHTFFVWIKAVDTGIQGDIVGQYAAGGFALILRNGYLTYYKNAYLASATPMVADNTWHHVGFVKQGSGAGQARLYVDGVPSGPAFTDSTSYQNSNMKMGLTMISPLGGLVDDARVYNRAISASEVTRLYELGATTHINTTIDTNDNLENGLVGHWTFDGPNMNIGSGTREVIDTSGSGNHGDWKNHATTTVAGKLGQGILFDGTDDFISMGSGDIPFTKTSAFSGTAWIKTRNTGAISSNYYYLGSSGWMFSIGVAGANSVEFGLLNDVANAGRYRMGSTNVLDGQWHFVAFTYDGSNTVAGIKLYTDGGLEGMSTFVNSDPGTLVDRDVRIGAAEYTIGNGSIFRFNGSLDDVRIYNVALSTSTVKRLYELGATTHINTTIDTNDELESGLVGHWTFDGPKMAWASSTAEVLDSSASSIEGDMINMDQQSATAGKMGQGMRFDGINDYINIGAATPHNNVPRKTITAWIKPSTVGEASLGRIVEKSQSSGDETTTPGNGFIFGVCNDGWLCTSNRLFFLQSFMPTDYGMWSSASNSLPIGVWSFVAVTYDNSSYTNKPIFYINSVVSTRTESNSPSGGTAPDDSAVALVIGNRAPGDRTFNGNIDDVRIYNRILSQAEVKRLYELGGGR